MSRLGSCGIARIAIAVLVVLMAVAGVETVRGDSHDTPAKLVSNTGQTVGGSASTQNSAQQFTTGSSEYGYVLTEVRVRLGQARSNTTTTYVTVNSDSGGSPGAVLSSLSNPSSFTSDAVKNFTLDTPLSLAKDTNYWVVFNVGLNASQGLRLAETAFTAEDSDSLTGWSIGDNSLWRTEGATNWNTTADIRPIHLRGYADVASTDATLFNLNIGDSNNIRVSYSPSFRSRTTSYRATVENDVDEITVRPVKNDSGATIAYLDEDDAALEDADDGRNGHQVDLAVGYNTVKVKVTAEDTTTTETYTVVVR